MLPLFTAMATAHMVFLHIRPNIVADNHVADELREQVPSGWPVFAAADGPRRPRDRFDDASTLAGIGKEELTLERVHAYCKRHPGRMVSYVTTTPTFAATGLEAKLRWFAATAALGQPCVSALRNASICGGHAVLFPNNLYAFAGDMWMADCGYVATLPDPRRARAAADTVYHRQSLQHSALPAHCFAAGPYMHRYWALSGLGDTVAGAVRAVNTSRFEGVPFDPACDTAQIGRINARITEAWQTLL